MHPVGFVIRIYRDARSSECQTLACVGNITPVLQSSSPYPNLWKN